MTRDAVQGWLILQRARGLLWVPVGLGIGIAVYFNLYSEPSLLWGCAMGLLALICAAAVFAWPYLALVFLVLCSVATGFVAAQLRAHLVAQPVLGWPYYGTLTGQVIKIDRSQSDRVRVTLRDPQMPPISQPRTPQNIRVSLPPESQPPKPDQILQITAYITPPTGLAEPGGYDFQRRAWFHGLGGVGYAREPPDIIGMSENTGYQSWIYAVRMRISAALRAQMPQPMGGFAAAILVGDRAHVDRDALRDLRRSNLAHLLAISGLHMGLLVGVVFFAIRAGLALIPPMALRLPGKKIAAVFALLAGLVYLQLSGVSVASERAFTMVAVMLLAVLLDRPALSLRAVALAACIILLRRPEYLFEPGFQMSFAATSALIVTFHALVRRTGWWLQTYWRRVAWFVLSLMLSSLIAGMATAPFAAYHFNQLPHYGVIANTLGLPLMSMIVMPSAVLAAVLWPFGLEWIALNLMGYGIMAILAIAAQVANLPGAVSLIVKPAGWVFGLVGIGFALFIVLQGKMRAIAALMILLGLWQWSLSERPDWLISANGRLIGQLNDNGLRSLNRARGNGFVARIWTENDARPFDQKRQNNLYAGTVDQGEVTHDVYYWWSKQITQEQVNELCATYKVLILPQHKPNGDESCRIFGQRQLIQSGSIALNADQPDHVITAKAVSGQRLWNDRRIRKQFLWP